MEYPSRVIDRPLQQSMQGCQFGPANPFVKFKKEEIEQSIPDRFEQVVAKYPNRLAVKTKNHELTYESLNQTANCIARAIVELRGEKAEPTALLFEQGGPLIAAILAVLKAGKFYIPLDPSYPRARISYMLQDCQTPVILTDTQNLATANELSRNGLRVLVTDHIETRLPEQNLRLHLPSEALAYIFYTSGSTGNSKGVVDNHRNVLHNIMRYTNGLHICMEDRLTLLQSCSFSGSVSSLFGALLNGASVFPFNPREETPEDLASWLLRQEITIYHSVPAIFRSFLNGKSRFPKIRLVRLEGDQASRRDLELFKRHFAADCILVNGLGTTETGIVRRYFISQEAQIDNGLLPVGYPVEDMEVFLLGDNYDVASTNEVGEIAVKSKYLALGYWGMPELTQSAFLPDPQGGTERIYRTGDLGRMLPNGCLEHLGRKDFRVKIRGHSIEVAEVEMALLGLASIKETVVLARKDQSGDQRLVAYIVPNGQSVPTITTLRNSLKMMLPEYMVPSAFVTLDGLPLTPNGKVDRKALPAPDLARPALGSSFAEPRSCLERILSRLWTEILGLEQVGVHDNFFELGGDSLSATQMISRLRSAFRLDLPLHDLFKELTVAGLAAAIVESQSRTMQSQDATHILAELEAMSEDEAERLLSSEIMGNSKEFL